MSARKNASKRKTNSIVAEKMALSEFANYIFKKNEEGDYWLPLDDDRVIFNVKLEAIFPNFFNRQIKIEQSTMKKYDSNKVMQSYGDFHEFRLMTQSELASAFLTPKLNKTYYKNKGIDLSRFLVVRDDITGKPVLCDGKYKKTFKNSNPSDPAMYIPAHYLHKNGNAENWDATEVAIACIMNGIIPKDDNIKNAMDLLTLASECKAGRREIDTFGNVILKSTVVIKEETNMMKENITKVSKTEDIAKETKREMDKPTDKSSNLTAEEKALLECDKNRFSYITYDKDKLYDLQGGHWDIFNESEANGRNLYQTSKGYVARNPLLDVQKNGVVAIDFGTKSTVVVYKNGNSLKIPLRIGTNNFNKAITDDQYENPTVEEFVDLKSFIKDYQKCEGRPSTKWKDFIIANLAYHDMLSNSSNLKMHYSFFTNIKQWAAGQAEVTISDQKGYMPIIKNYMNDESEIDLVELYAYYIGLHINNMNNGIFLNYKLSYPVSFDLDIREKIRLSFEKGIKKTIPEIVQKDEKTFKKFKVRLVASEPASYAACAIQQYGIVVPKEKALFYGVFDFGGGTSDFDFGLWKECDDEDSSYSYVLQRLASVGDSCLGGENLLEILAYEVLKSNLDIVKKNGLTFIRPSFCERFKGDEAVVADPPTRIARRNLYIVKEELRKFWQGDYNEIKDESEKKKKVELDMISQNGDMKNSVPLNVDYVKLYQILKKRIENGVELFEDGRQKALSKLSLLQKSAWLDKPQYIFLAGNSCKSSIVLDALNRIYKQQIDDGTIKIYHPLQSSTKRDDMQLYSPNGKTGVAWGLLDIGDSIEFIDNELASEGKIEFKYCLGIGKKDVFVPKVTPNSEYGRWIKLIRANKDEITVYYTDSMVLSDVNIPIMETRCFVYEVEEPDNEKYVYVRMIDSTTIEITNAYETEIDEINKAKVISKEEEITGADDLYIETYDLKMMN